MFEEQKLLSEYNEGDTYKGEEITTLYAAKSDYLIYEGDNSGEITIATDSNEIMKLCSHISPRISIITEYLVNAKDKKKFVDHIGLAYTEVIEGNIETAEDICDKLINRIESYKNNIGKFYYLLSCLGMVVLVIIIGYFINLFKLINEVSACYFTMVYAAIGGFLSEAKDLKKIQIDSSDFGYFQFFYGISRILIAMFSGLIVYIVIKSKLIFPELEYQENNYVIYLFAVVAGFSETWIPNLLKKIDRKQ